MRQEERGQLIRGVYLPRGSGNLLHTLTYKEGDAWVCRCLEYDITTKSARSKEAAVLGMKRLVHLFLDGARRRTPAPAAPQEWADWASVHAEP